MRKWQTVEADESVAADMAVDSGLPRPLARLLVSRGITEARQAEQFLNPRLSGLSDPFELPNMRAAVDRVWTAVTTGESIAVFGDYDVDGVSSTALVTAVLRDLGAKAGWCLPRRADDGYGLSSDGLERCAEKLDPSLIITVDCGSRDIASIAAASDMGIDVIVTDHHEITGEPAKPVALVNPKSVAGHPGWNLAGVGVAFKFCHALVKHGRDAGHEGAAALDLKKYMGWVALGTVADVVPLVGENRTLTRFGLDRLSSDPGIGLSALMQIAGVRGTVKSHHIGFGLGPRLNAAGRLGAAETSLELLMAESDTEARVLAQALDDANKERRAIEQDVVKQAKAQVAEWFDESSTHGIVAASDDWHIGVVGLAASRLCEKYSLPAVVISFDGDAGRGSCRSVPGLDVTEVLSDCSEHLERFGGHAAAAGLSIKKTSYDAFVKAFSEQCGRRLDNLDPAPVQRIDAWLTAADIERRLVEEQRRLEPFGEGNRSPVWAVSGARVVGEPRILKERHLKMTLALGNSQVDAIGFGMADREVPDGAIDVAFTLEINEFRGYESLQLKLRDFRASISP